MRKKLLLLTPLLFWHIQVNAADLVEVYNQALTSDPIFQQAIAKSLVTAENVPISYAAVLPSLVVTMNPAITHLNNSGTNYLISTFPGVIAPRNLTERNYSLNLILTQQVFNMGMFQNIEIQLANAKAAEATLNSELQSLMVRVANAYFAILQDEDNLEYAIASKRNYAQQLDQTQQQYKVGIKTLTDVATAQASYASASSDYIAAQTALANDRENLRVLTGIYYTDLASLRRDFPLVSPDPDNVEEWVKTAILQNWRIKAAQSTLNGARHNIYEQLAGNLPTMNLQISAFRQYNQNITNYHSFTDREGPGSTTGKQIMLNLNFPVFAGGQYIAQYKQASYNYDLQQQVLEQTIRDTANTTRQTYLNLKAGISLVHADEEAVKSAISSYEGFEASYKVGTETLVDVLNQQAKVYQAQTTYAKDRYGFVKNIFVLKQAAGTLSYDDIRDINGWLVEKPVPKGGTDLVGQG